MAPAKPLPHESTTSFIVCDSQPQDPEVADPLAHQKHTTDVCVSETPMKEPIAIEITSSDEEVASSSKAFRKIGSEGKKTPSNSKKPGISQIERKSTTKKRAPSKKKSKARRVQSVESKAEPGQSSEAPMLQAAPAPSMDAITIRALDNLPPTSLSRASTISNELVTMPSVARLDSVEVGASAKREISAGQQLLRDKAASAFDGRKAAQPRVRDSDSDSESDKGDSTVSMATPAAAFGKPSGNQANAPISANSKLIDVKSKHASKDKKLNPSSSESSDSDAPTSVDIAASQNVDLTTFMKSHKVKGGEFLSAVALLCCIDDVLRIFSLHVRIFFLYLALCICLDFVGA